MAEGLDSILFFDFEISKAENKIVDIGALLGPAEYHGKSIDKFREIASGAAYICGHNIIAHDIPLLRNIAEIPEIDKKIPVDTLLLSPLLFPKKPYHRLVKDYKKTEMRLFRNNPLLDSRLCRELLADEVAAFNSLDSEMKNLYWNLLKDIDGFKGFFKLTGFSGKITSAWKLCCNIMGDSICVSVDHEKNFNAYPVAAAYICAFIRYGCPESILPAWVLSGFPESVNLMMHIRSDICDNDKCSYCSARRDLKGALKRHFGHDEFRKFSPDEEIPAQQRAVQMAVENRSLIAVFPTGGGKSITFQLPALMAGESTRGLTVVISPLQALMKDQVDNLLEKDITRAVTLNGLLSPLDRVDAIERVENGQAHILYVAPESLRSEKMLDLIAGRVVSRFVIDEAHCFSSWGHDFRVDYLFIGKFIRLLQEKQRLSRPIPVSCLTATAKPAVINDIKKYFMDTLDLQLEEIFVDSARTNLEYRVYNCENERGKIETLADLISRETGPVIVYCSRTATTGMIAEKLGDYGIRSAVYHGKLKSEDKKNNMKLFMEGNVNVAVATNAFGMGVDKDDVSLVIHYDIPSSLENYAQETGRAGRDPGIQARCCLLFDKEDIKKHFQLLYGSRINKKEISELWKGVRDLTKNAATVSRSPLEIAMMSGWDTDQYDLETKVKTALSVLEEQSFLERGFNRARVHAVSLLVRDVETSSRMIDSEPLSDNDKRLAKAVIQKIIKEGEQRIDYLAEIIDAHRDDVIKIIDYLKKMKILNDKDMDLSAYINTAAGPNNSNNSREIYKRYRSVEKVLLQYLEDEPEKLSLKAVCSSIREGSSLSISPDDIRKILNYWEIKNLITKNRVDPVSMLYRFTCKVPYDKLLENSEYIHTLSSEIIDILHNRAAELRKTNGQGSNMEVLVEFSVPFLRRCSEQLLESRLKTAAPEDYHKALIYLNSIGSIRLDKGFFILYSPLTITRTEKNARRQFSEKEFDILKKFYEQKIEQIHIMQKYALFMQENIDHARRFTSDYFTLSHKDFIDKYYRTSEEKEQITKPIPQETFVKIFGKLSPEQLRIVNDAKNRRVLVAAGPGSGKTRVLVHKVGAILATEDVKPEQFLMLTFSRSAVMEFRSRLYELIGETARYVDIFTYHSFCFNIRGIPPAEDQLDLVIETTIAEINTGRLDVTRLKNKSTLVIDEFQDLDAKEYMLIQKIIEVSGDIRVLAVGDDDQNIFSFRGASNEFMNRFVGSGAERYELLTNFRSVTDIVQYSNRLRKNIKGRLKQGDLVAKSNETGRIGIYNFSCNNLVIPLVKTVRESGVFSDTAVLTVKNENVSMIHACLKQEGIPSSQGSSEIDFRIKDMEEIAFFTGHLRDIAYEGEIPPDLWLSLRAEVINNYGKAKHIDQALTIIDRFRETYNHLFYREWMNYILEMHINDFTTAGSGITVSTIHRAKGREYDTVYLMIPDYDYTADDSLRLIYVAITRAKRNLFVFSNSNFFTSIADENTIIIKDEFEYVEPGNVSVDLNYNKVNLGFFKNDRVIKTLGSIHSGTSLEYKENDQTFYSHDRHACMMSKAGRSELDAWLNRGFRVKEAEAEYVVNWYCREDEKIYPVVLPRVSLEKGK